MSPRFLGFIAAAGLGLLILPPGGETPRASRQARSHRSSAGTLGARRERRAVDCHGRVSTATGWLASTRQDEIRGLLAHWTRLRPEERGVEDEIRCALTRLVDDGNAADIVAALSERERGTEFGAFVFGRWAAVDPRAAAAWLAGQDQPVREQVNALARVAVRDARTWAAIAGNLPAGGLREQWLEDASRLLGAADPARAVAIAREMAAGPARRTVLLARADDWAQADPAAAARWIVSEPDAAWRDELIQAAALAQVPSDPIGAIEWTLASSPTGTGSERAIEAICSNWMSFAPDQARQFLALIADAPPAPRDR